MAPIKIIYFPVRARQFIAALVAEIGNLDYEIETVTEEWLKMKADAPFGQLPILIDGDIRMAQSLAIARYLARKADLLGKPDADFAQSEQLLQEAEDLYIASATNLPKTWSKAKPEGFDTFLHETVPRHLGYLEKLVKDGKFTSEITIGELAVYAVLNLIRNVKDDILEGFPGVTAVYDRIASHPKVTAWVAASPQAYFVKPE
eukprot:TRINITY_DN15554_c0_g1_i2.p1 TRINITY_DN15554_c0_g1~~TRINITY_DN15554_c0_g1_i2.p1  ORF type:complete len:203 (+),score=50.67 TRINITY_DN15554_c0_g1_i2:652-1260(+)